MPKDEYALSSQKHEVCISYGTILNNLRRRIIEYQREASQVLTSGKHNLSAMSFEFNTNLLLQLDEVIDLPFKSHVHGAHSFGHPNTGKRLNEKAEVDPFMAQKSQTEKNLLSQTHANLNMRGCQSPSMSSEI